MTPFKVGDWVVRRPQWRDSHPFWVTHKDTPMKVVFVRKGGGIDLEGSHGAWIADFFDPCPPPSTDLGEWL